MSTPTSPKDAVIGAAVFTGIFLLLAWIGTVLAEPANAATCTTTDDGGYWAQEVTCPTPEPTPADVSQLPTTGIPDDGLSASLILAGFLIAVGIVIIAATRKPREPR